MKSPQIFQKVCVENMKRSEIINIIRSKMKVTNVFNNLFQSCANGISAIAWVFTVKGIKDYDLIRRVFKITLHHSQFIQISK